MSDRIMVPDLVGTIGRAYQTRAAMDEARARRQENAGLAELAPMLALGQGPEYDSALGRLAGLGWRGAQVALPLIEQSRQNREFQQWQAGGGGGGMPAAPSGAPAATPAVLPPGDQSLPRGLRNNNPLNLTYVSGQPGVQGSDGRFGRYGSIEDGVAAAARQMRIYAGRGVNTLEGIISRWAPPGENNTGAYIAAVARATGLDPRAPIDMNDPQVVSRIVMAMGQHENGRPIPDGEAVLRGVTRGLGGGGDTIPASAPAPGGGAPAGVDPAVLRRIEMGLASNNPQIRRAAQAQLEMLRLRNQGDRQQPPTISLGEGPQGPAGVYERTANGLRYIGPPARQANDAGPFGTGTEGRAGSMLIDLAPRIQSGEATPAEEEQFRAAYALWTRERIDPATNQRLPGLPATPGVQRALAALDARGSGGGAQPGGDVVGAPDSPNPLAQPPQIERDAAGNTRVVQAPQTTPQAREAARKMETEVGRVNDAIDGFLAALEADGGTGVAAYINNPQSPSAVRINTAYNNLVTALRSEAFLNTGVLQPAEMSMISRNFLDPQSLRGLLASRDSYRAQMAELRNFIQAGLRRSRAAAGLPVDQGQPAPAAPGGDTVPTVAGPGGVGEAFPPPQAPRRTPPQIGTVEDGYRFRGGDPSSPSSWERVQ